LWFAVKDKSDSPRSRRRAQTRARAWGALIIVPFGILIAIIRAVSPHDYPQGDIRNEPVFWLIVTALFVGVGAIILFGSLWSLRDQDPSD